MTDESEARLPEAAGVDGAECSRFGTSHIQINCNSAPYQAHKVDLNLRGHVGKALPPYLYEAGGP
ncbi:MAG: hypothetical protein ABI330_10335 [Caldimonas sp.]